MLPNTFSESYFEATIAALDKHFDPQLRPDYEHLDYVKPSNFRSSLSTYTMAASAGWPGHVLA